MSLSVITVGSAAYHHRCVPTGLGATSFDLNPPPLVEAAERFDRSDVILWRRFFIFCPVTEIEAKEHARVPLTPARRRCGRSARKLTRPRLGYGGLRQSARFFPSAPPMLGAGQWENQNLQTISSPLPGGYLRPPALREEPHLLLRSWSDCVAPFDPRCFKPFGRVRP